MQNRIDFNLSKNCVLADMTVRAAQGDNPAIVASTGFEFQITDTKFYVPVVTLSKENDITFRPNKIRIYKNYKMEQIQITNDYAT